jgi:hypothetical protein
VTANFTDKVGPGLLRRVRRSAAAGRKGAGRGPSTAEQASQPVPDFLPLPLASFLPILSMEPPRGQLTK